MDPIFIVLGLLVVAVGLFATRALPVDLVTIFLLLALVLTGILDTAQAFAGFSSQIIIILGSIFIINGALLEGRVLDVVSSWLLRVAAGSTNKLLLALHRADHVRGAQAQDQSIETAHAGLLRLDPRRYVHVDRHLD